jgi:restriction system protein
MSRRAKQVPIESAFYSPVPVSGSHFIGRARELNQLRDWFSNPGQRIAFITGEYGSGKTSLIRVFIESANRLFPGGIYYAYGSGPESPAQFAQRSIPKQIRGRSLLVLDEADALPADMRPEVRAILATQPKISLLMAGRQAFGFADLDQANIRLGSLTEAEFRELIAKRLSGSEKVAAEKLWESFNGNPSVAELAGRTVREGLHSLSELVRELADFQYPGILGSDGKPITPRSVKSKEIIVEVKQVNDQLLEMINANPSAIHSLGSRKFEEIVAEILIRKGYRVELTPASKDGGFDMYAARKETLGEFLYLVECKKYTPRHKVGVQIVRALHGVVQQKRATAGIIATTSYFTKGAEEFRQDVVHQMHLADYVELQKWLRSALTPHTSEPK